MKTEFTKEYILKHKGCYEETQVNELPFDKHDHITIETLYDTLPIKDFSWFLIRKCDLTLNQKRKFAVHCAKFVLPIYEKKYPNDSRVSDCIDATELFLDGKITRDELVEKNAAAYAATAGYPDAADAAAAAAAYAAHAAYAAYAAYAAKSAAYAAYAAYYAAYAYKKHVWVFVEQLKQTS